MRLTPAERAYVEMLNQEARLERIERAIERKLNEQSSFADIMQGEAYYAPSVLHQTGDRWEICELTRINATRPASRIAFQLPTSAYDARRCLKYGECGR